MERVRLRRFELLVTLECHWGCADCYRGVDQCFPANSHVTADQMRRLLRYFDEENYHLDCLKINGGEPFCNPELGEIVALAFEAKPKLVSKIRLYTTYTLKTIRKRHKLPQDMRIICCPQTNTGYKQHHIPHFVSPTESGILQAGMPIRGSWASERQCRLQIYCGRAFTTWGFSASGLEWTLSHLLGMWDQITQEYKEWGNPEICRHCPMCLSKPARKRLIRRAIAGDIPRTSHVFDVKNLSKAYDHLAKNQPHW